MNSLDPRVSRLPELNGTMSPKPLLDQLSTYEVFVQPKEGKPFQHEGSIHAPDVEMAFILAKESLTRRFTCVSLFVTATTDVGVSATTEGDQNIYDISLNEPVAIIMGSEDRGVNPSVLKIVDEMSFRLKDKTVRKYFKNSFLTKLG